MPSFVAPLFALPFLSTADVVILAALVFVLAVLVGIFLFARHLSGRGADREPPAADDDPLPDWLPDDVRHPRRPSPRPAPRPRTPPEVVVPEAMPTKFCHACGAVLDARAELCPGCGVRQPGAPTGWYGDHKRHFLVAVLLSVFLGAFGLQWFYLGDIASGLRRVVVTLLCCPFGGPVVGILIGLVDAAVLLAQGPDHFNRMYNDP